MDFDNLFDKNIQEKMKIIVCLITCIEDIFDTMGLDGKKDLAMRRSFLCLVNKIIVEKRSRKSEEPDDTMEHIGDIIQRLNMDEYKLGDDE